MQARARQQYIRTSPRKMRIVADVVRGKNVEQALTTLHFMPQKAARTIERILHSAVANLIDQNPDERIDETALVVTEIRVDEAPYLKRFRPVSRGRAHPILKRSSHLSVAVGLPEGTPADA
ncbi:MAG: 50S ribosomal protein L22 [Rhodothermaceae bacterium]|nr:50S ribosomal protein L22 [Rhodothermaceae bacterium]